jgi:radical SAM protein with 4Fe4S-binding SPASM domain
MDCPQVESVNGEKFFQRIGLNRRRMPVSASMELTFRCNLRCAHCYLGEHRGPSAARGELDMRELRGIFDQMAEAGTLWVLLTGGEPLLRPDFREIYTYVKRKGLIPTLFTNGTLLNAAMVDFLADMPPVWIEISLYGATRETYERVTGNPGSYDRCMRGIDLLLERGLPLKLKAMAMSLTVDEIPAMKALSESKGVEFRFDPILCDDIDCSHSPNGLRLSPEEVARLDLSDPARAQEWQDFYARQAAIQRDQRYLYSCGGGISAYHVDPYGRLSLCMSVRNPSYDLRSGSLVQGWEGFLRDLRFTPADEASTCRTCRLQPLCGICPGWADADNPKLAKPVKYLCQVGHRRAEALGIIQ